MHKLKRGCVIAKIEPIEECNLITTLKVKSSHSKSPDFKTLRDKIIVDKEHKCLVEGLIKDNTDLFAECDLDLACTDTMTISINTGNHIPVKQRPYHTPLTKIKIVDNAIDDMLETGVIRPSMSPWASPIVVVDKKNGSKSFCVDFRALNKRTTLSSWPLAVIDDLLALLGKVKYFTCLNLKSGYWQVAVDDKDKEKTAFTSQRGLYEYNVMPFGLANAPGIFQQLMSTVLRDMSHFSLAYLDDVIIFSPTLEEHQKHISQIFECLREHKLKMKISKCKFVQSETQYLGFIVDGNGIKPDPEKVKVIRAMLPPENVKGVHSFLGMISYYHHFIPKFSEIAIPLIKLTKKFAKFEWTTECQSAFEVLKNSLSTIPVLGYPDVNKPYVLYTDASDNCIGACL